MFKIKLSILLLISFSILSCTSNQISYQNHKYSLAYIGGEFDGLLLKNYLVSNLKNLNIYDNDSPFQIKANINHKTNLFVTNIDNTSDREKISTKLSIKIIDKKLDCELFKDKISVSQFYIYASSDKFLSNQTALKKIKKDNMEAVVKKFINKLKNINIECNEERKPNINN
jgi:hypothetical protein